MYKIGVPACFMYPDSSRSVFEKKSLSYIENDMARYVTRRGLLPVLLPDVEDELLFEILKEMDGFVFQGGSDLAPETYGEQPIGRWKGDPHRDQYELKILDFAIRNDKPVLAICRGFQLMNVYFGGTLYQDIGTQLPEADRHRSGDHYDTISHPIDFVPGTFLARLYAGAENPKVNTVHHQAVKELGRDLEVWATSPDGLIEAFGYTGAVEGRVMGVEWHPEFTPTLKDQLIDHEILYDAFLEQVRK